MYSTAVIVKFKKRKPVVIDHFFHLLLSLIH